MVVNQMNVLMQSVRLILEDYPDDYIPSDIQIKQIERLVKNFSHHLQKHLEALANEKGVPIEHLGENSSKRRLL